VGTPLTKGHEILSWNTRL